MKRLNGWNKEELLEAWADWCVPLGQKENF